MSRIRRNNMIIIKKVNKAQNRRIRNRRSLKHKIKSNLSNNKKKIIRRSTRPMTTAKIAKPKLISEYLFIDFIDF